MYSYISNLYIHNIISSKKYSNSKNLFNNLSFAFEITILVYKVID